MASLRKLVSIVHCRKHIGKCLTFYGTYSWITCRAIEYSCLEILWSVGGIHRTEHKRIPYVQEIGIRSGDPSQ